MLPGRLHQRHLDPGSEASREGPPGAVRLTFPHKPGFVLTRRPETGVHPDILGQRRQEKSAGYHLKTIMDLPVNQVSEISKDHVADGAEVLSGIIRAELHEDHLFTVDFRRASDHQRSFLSTREWNRQSEHQPVEAL